MTCVFASVYSAVNTWSWNYHFSHVIWGKMSFAIAMLTLYFFEFYFRSLWMTSSNGDIFRVIGPLRGEFTGRQWRGALVFSVICACATGWINSLNAVELRRHRTHYDVTVMSTGIVPPDGRWCPGDANIQGISSSDTDCKVNRILWILSLRLLCN